MSLERLLQELEGHGVLLLADNRRPALAQLVAGGPIQGSWWGHLAGKRIFKLADDLGKHPDVLLLKLVDGKLTFAHRRLWNAIYSLATAREAWQMRGLSAPARRLLAKLDAEDSLGSDQAVPGVRDSTKAMAELEQRLLVHASEIHTESGAHAKLLQSWTRWARAAKRVKRLELDSAKAELERTVAALPGGGRLPWQAPAR